LLPINLPMAPAATPIATAAKHQQYYQDDKDQIHHALPSVHRGNSMQGPKFRGLSLKLSFAAIKPTMRSTGSAESPEGRAPGQCKFAPERRQTPEA